MKEDLWMSIRSDRLKGLSYVSIAKKYSLDRRTVKNIVYLTLPKNKEKRDIFHSPLYFHSFLPSLRATLVILEAQ